METPAPASPALPTAPETAPVATSAADLAALTLESLPAGEASETVALPAPETPLSSERDSLDRPFDPAKFRPKKDTKGRWVNLNGGRPSTKGKEESETSGGSAPARSYVPVSPAGPDRFDLAAELYCRTFYAVADNTFQSGGEWQPESPEEHAVMKQAVAAYLRSKDLEELPPGWMLVFVVGGYTAKRLQKPKTNEKWKYLVAYWKARVSAWFGGIFKKKNPPTVN